MQSIGVPRYIKTRVERISDGVVVTMWHKSARERIIRTCQRMNI